MITSLASKVWAALASSNNQFLSGGFVLMLVGGAAAYLRNLPGQLWHWLIGLVTTTVDVTSNDSAYDWIVFWAQSSDYGRRARRITARHLYGEYGSVGAKLKFIPAEGEHRLWFEGRPVSFTRNRIGKDGSSTPSTTGGGGSNNQLVDLRETVTLTLWTRDRAMVERLFEEAKSRFESAENDFTRVYSPTAFGWDDRFVLKRTLDTVELPEGARTLEVDIRKFFSKREWYHARGIPYRMGLMFYGPPGTGKSSAVLAMAGSLGVSVYAVNMASISDSELEGLVRTVQSERPYIMLFEDIDTCVPSRESSEDKPHKVVSLGTLLNVLDGVNSPENAIIIMTTNYPERLDPALTRKGRVDRAIEFSYATERQIRAMVARFGQPDTEADRLVALMAGKAPMANVQDALRQRMMEEELCQD